MRKLREPVDPTEWYMTPPTVNAYYEPTENQIGKSKINTFCVSETRDVHYFIIIPIVFKVKFNCLFGPII